MKTRTGQRTVIYDRHIPFYDFWPENGSCLFFHDRSQNGQRSRDGTRVNGPVMWSETVGLRTGLRPKKIGLGLGLGPAGLMLCCETPSTASCHARRHNDLEGHSKFSSTI